MQESECPCFHRLLATVPHGENHPCVEALMAHCSSVLDRLSRTMARKPLSNGTFVDVQCTITLADWCAAAKFHRSCGAASTTNSLAHKNITKENQHLLKNVRGDDKTVLEELTFEDRDAFGEKTLAHKAAFVAEAKALGWTEEDLKMELDIEMREFARVHKNPQKGQPLATMKNYVPENCHAGLRTTPNCMRRLNDTVQIAHKNGFATTATAVTDALRKTFKSKFREIAKKLDNEGKTGNMKGEMCNLHLQQSGKIIEAALEALGSEAHQLSVLAQAFVHAMNKQMLGVLRKKARLAPSDLDPHLEKGKRCLNVIGAMFGWQTAIQPCQRTDTHA